MSKITYLLLACFFASATLSANAWNHKPINLKNQEPINSLLNDGLKQLNQSMQATLGLSSGQYRAIRQANRAFWKERQAILEQSGKVARHTALLAAWDRWARLLESILNQQQYEDFLAWQYEVSPLSEKPY